MDTMPDASLIAEIREAAFAVPGVRGVEKCFARKTGFKYHGWRPRTATIQLEVPPTDVDEFPWKRIVAPGVSATNCLVRRADNRDQNNEADEYECDAANPPLHGLAHYFKVRHHSARMMLEDVAVIHPLARAIVRHPGNAHAPPRRHVHRILP